MNASKIPTDDEFESCLNQTFVVQLEGIDAIEMQLISVDRMTALNPQTDQRQRFSVVFRGPEEPQLEQSIFPLEHSDLGTVELFLVPIGPDKEGMLYEAVFT